MADGEVEIMLNGKPVTLKCSVRALRRVNELSGGAGAYQKLAAFDFNAYVAIVAAGLGKKADEVEADVYETGLPDLTEPLSNFVTRILNGGRDPDKKATATGEA